MNTKDIRQFGFLRAAVAVPPLTLANVSANEKTILSYIKRASAQKVGILVFPELSITGYTLGDLVSQEIVLQESLRALRHIKNFSVKYNVAICVGLPMRIENKLFNVAAVIAYGHILGIVPKTHLPGYKEFYEKRWFSPASALRTKDITLFDEKVAIGTDILFRPRQFPEATFGVEICEDVWTPLPPSSYQAVSGATILINLSASNELVGKAQYRRSLITQQSARTISAYLYASSGVHESTTDTIYGGHSIIAENGAILEESKRFAPSGELILADLDIQHLLTDRAKTTSFGEKTTDIPQKEFRIVDFEMSLPAITELRRNIAAHPFVPQNVREQDERAQEIFSIQSLGLAKRLAQAKINKVVLGLSGGLDSTLALLVAVETFRILKLNVKNIHAFTMPGFATSKRTKSNAAKLAQMLKVSFESIDIQKGVRQQLQDIGHKGKIQDVTFENAQARYRTMMLMNKANQMRGLVVGTGDLSELALGWNTFSGDQISHYNVNAGVPKTLVSYLVRWASNQDRFSAAQKVLLDILDTPISPELKRANKKEITQKTEDILGPYELHDFFLYHFIRWDSPPAKIAFLAQHAFGKKYASLIIKKHLRTFITRFFQNQWKRSVMPDGPKVGSVALSPRSDWRMPSDADATMWLRDLK